MIPHILELKNFLSYGEPIQRLDLTNHSLICLSGKNGHGKSALLDAITWAVWGQARKTSGTVKADEGLVRLGQTQMMVSLEFLFNGHTYRIRREFAKTYGKPYTALDFELFDLTGQRFISLTEKTVKTTQLKIEQLLGLDYETFINSAFIRQGQSNEFSKKSPKERKHILASILGLAKYDTLQQQALEKVKVFSEEKRALGAFQEQFNIDLEQETTLTNNQSIAHTTLATCNTQLEQTAQTIKTLEKEISDCQSKKITLQTLQHDLTIQRQKQLDGQQALKSLLDEWKKNQAIQRSLPTIQSLYQEKQLLKKEETNILDLQQRAITAQETILRYKELHHIRITTLKTEQDLIIEQHTKAVEEADRALHNHTVLLTQQETALQKLMQTSAQHEQEKATLEQTCKQQEADTKAFAATKQQFDKRKAFYQMLIQRGNWTKNELTDLDQRQKTLDTNNNPACPLCDQLLTIKRKQFLLQQFSRSNLSLQHRLHRLSIIIQKLKDLLLQQHNQLQLLTQCAEQNTKTLHTLEEINKRLELERQEAVACSKELEQLKEKNGQLRQQLLATQTALQSAKDAAQQCLENDAELKNYTTTIITLEQEKTSFAYDQHTLQRTQERLAAIDQILAQAENQFSTHTAQQERKNRIQAACKELKILQKSIASCEEQQLLYATIDEQAQAISNDLAIHTQTLQRLSQEKEQILHAIGSMQSKLEHIGKIKIKYLANKERIDVIDREIEDYQTLATAFGKNGIQALLIEESIPEIEHEANVLLSRLTNNQSQIFIESLRDLKSGGVKETLDIRITDSAGIRPYEMYSGGEAFRVDFALRIAIAKLLARRAGTALQTLIIDEGFGSQDEEGLAHIMESLYAIQQDFAKIIIVSHLPEFKHNFPVHFIVEKQPTGSVVHVEERG